MRRVLRRFEQFLFYDYTSIEKHLQNMALKGWQLSKITNFYWEYHRIEPKQLTYTITYFSEASVFNPYPTDNQQNFYEYCKSAGWHLVTEWAQMQIFCTEQEDILPIETDDSVKLKAIHRSMKKNFLPSYAFLLLISLLYELFQIYLIKKEPITQLANSGTVFTIITWMIITIQTLIPLIGYTVWYNKSLKSIKMGGSSIEPVVSYRKISFFMYFLLIISIALITISWFVQPFGWVAILAVANMILTITLVLAIRNLLKKRRVAKRINLTLTVISCILFHVIFTGATFGFIFYGINSKWFNKKPVETYTANLPNGEPHTWNIYHDQLPLTIEDMQDVDYQHYSYQWTEQESLLLAKYEGRQDSFPDGKLAPSLKYTIVDVKLPYLLDLCLYDLLTMYHYEDEPVEYRRDFILIDDPAWQADAVYQLYHLEEAREQYIICWGKRIVFIDFEIIPNIEQINVAIHKLRK